MTKEQYLRKERQRKIDIARYKEYLKEETAYDDRLFFLRGIVNLSKRSEFNVNVKDLIEQTNIPESKLEKLCCVEENGLYNPKNREQVIIAIKYGL